MKKKILIADDRPDDAVAVARALNAHPEFEADICDLSPYEIRKRVSRAEYDLLLLDCELRGLSTDRASDDELFGLRILREMAPFFAERSMTVVIYTIVDVFAPGPNPTGDGIRECIAEGLAAGCLRKPFVPERHMEVLSRFLKQGKMP